MITKMNLAVSGSIDAEDRLHDRVYREVSRLLIEGHLSPGDKVTIRGVAELTGTSMTPARLALARLVEKGALDASQGKSPRVPFMTVTRWEEICVVRIALETVAIGLAAERISAAALAELRRLAAELGQVRSIGDSDRDRVLVSQFQLGAYHAAGAPDLLRIIDDLWLITGPYLRMMYPHHIATVPTDWRSRLCDAFEQRDEKAARREMRRILTKAFAYVRGRLAAR